MEKYTIIYSERFVTGNQANPIQYITLSEGETVASHLGLLGIDITVVWLIFKGHAILAE